MQGRVGRQHGYPLGPHSVPFFSQELLGDVAALAAAPAAPTGRAVAAEAILADPPPTSGGLAGTGRRGCLAAAKAGTEHTARGPEPAAGPHVVSEESPGSLLSPPGDHRCGSDTWGK